MFSRMIFVSIFHVLWLSTAYGKEAAAFPMPRVDERVELLGIVFRFAGAPEYKCIYFKQYDEAIKRHFGDFKDHRVVNLAQKLRSGPGIAYDAVISYAVHLTIADGRVTLPDQTSEKTLEALDSRWTKNDARQFAEALDDFYGKSRFRVFYDAHRDMYRRTEEHVAKITNKVDYPWFAGFYGHAEPKHFHLLLNLISENNGYGAKCKFKDGHEEPYAVLGISGPEEKLNENGFIFWLVHEFNHSFCNPLVNRFMEELKPAAGKLYPFVAEAMSKQAYSSAEIMLYEYLVRACEIRYMQSHGFAEEADHRLRTNRDLGFLLIDAWVMELGRYEKERDQFPALESFMPEIVERFNAVITDDYLAKLDRQRKEKFPKVVSTDPENGAIHVDPSITEIRVTFDRPMNAGWSWCTRDGNKTMPPITENRIQWSEDKKTCVYGIVALKPGRTYNVWLNSEPFSGFRSEDNIPLEPVHYTFTTKGNGDKP